MSGVGVGGSYSIGDFEGRASSIISSIVISSSIIIIIIIIIISSSSIIISSSSTTTTSCIITSHANPASWPGVRRRIRRDSVPRCR